MVFFYGTQKRSASPQGAREATETVPNRTGLTFVPHVTTFPSIEYASIVFVRHPED